MTGISLAILPVGLREYELKTLECILPRLAFIASDISILNNVDVPHSAFEEERDQYRADGFLLFDSNIACDRLLIVTNVDLFSGRLNFVFGIAELGGRKAVISTYRLEGQKNLFEERILKEMVHELGHTLGLRHCTNPKCVMHFSNTLEDTDIKDWRYCSRCSKGLRSI